MLNMGVAHHNDNKIRWLADAISAKMLDWLKYSSIDNQWLKIESYWEDDEIGAEKSLPRAHRKERK